MASPSSDSTSEQHLVHGMFTKLEKQLEIVHEWNRQRHWGIPDEAFDISLPDWPDEKLVTAVIVPYLPDVANEGGVVITGIERTFQELLMCAKAEQYTNWCWRGYDASDSGNLWLYNAERYKPGLRCELIDLGCRRGQAPEVVRSHGLLPSAGILAAAALHPHWVRSMDGCTVPYVWVPGYLVDVAGAKEFAFSHVPRLSFCPDERGLELLYGGSGDGNHPYWAVPSFI